MARNKLPIRKKRIGKKYEEDTLTIALNVFILKKKQYILLNSNREKQVIFLIIPNEGRWHYIAVKQLPALLKEITSKQRGDFLLFDLSLFF